MDVNCLSCQVSRKDNGMVEIRLWWNPFHRILGSSASTRAVTMMQFHHYASDEIACTVNCQQHFMNAWCSLILDADNRRRVCLEAAHVRRSDCTTPNEEGM